MRVAVAVVCSLLLAVAADAAEKKVSPVLDFEMESLTGKKVDLSKYQGQAVLFVNVASRCGYTPQYEGLQALYEKYKDQGLVVVGVPCNQFGGQEPGTAEEIADFCESKFGVTFPMLAKVDVNGEDACPLYKKLTSLKTEPKEAGPVSWNFEKFLVNRDGEVVGRFGSGVKPMSKKLVAAIESALKK